MRPIIWQKSPKIPRMTALKKLWMGLLAGALLPALSARGDEPARAVDYLQDVKPILVKHCTACHGSEKQKSGLRLDSASLARRGGDSGPAVEPGKRGGRFLCQGLTRPGVVPPVASRGKKPPFG